jgi:Tfp pilus assembly protein PilV
MKTPIHAHLEGFTLVEVLVAISLLLLVIIGPMQILSRANNSSAYANEQVIAWFLAQEGLELAQQGRDNFLIQYFNNPGGVPNPWARFRTTTLASCFTATGCGIFSNNDGSLNVVACSGVGTPCQLYIEPNTSTDRARYQHTSAGNTVTPFTRVIKMSQSGDEIAATSTVTWRTGSLIDGQKVETATYFFNIYDTP